MEQQTHKYIVLSYKLYTVKDGQEELAEETTEKVPFAFLTGFGMTLEGFEEAVKDLNTDDEFDFTLPQEQGYGEYDETHVVDIAKDVFIIDGEFDHQHIFKGATVPLQNEDGNHFLGRVLDITDEQVKMDLNHPLAGKDLHFTGKITEAREATDKEVENFIKHMEQHSCGCGCGCDDCDNDGKPDHVHHESCGCGHCHH